MAKKSEIAGEFIITINDNNSVEVSRIYKSTKSALKEIWTNGGKPLPEKEWNTQDWGRNVLKEFCGGERKGIIGEYSVEREDNNRINVIRTYKVAKDGLREAAKELKFPYSEPNDYGWNTQRFGSILVNFAKTGELPNVDNHNLAPKEENAVELSGMANAKITESDSFKRNEKDNVDYHQTSDVNWEEDTVLQGYKYVKLDELVKFLSSNSMKGKLINASDFTFVSGQNLAEALRITDGYCYCTICSKKDSVDQWEAIGQNGACIKVEVNYRGWEKENVFYTDLEPKFGEGVTALDAMSIKTATKNDDLNEIVFVKKADGNDALPYRVLDIILGKDVTNDEHQKYEKIIKNLGIISSNEEGAEVTKEQSTDWKEMDNEEKLDLLDQEIEKMLDWDTEKRIKEMFFDAVPNGTYIWSLNTDYEEQDVASSIDCAVVDYDANCMRYIKGIKFKVEDGSLYAIQLLNDDEDEVLDCFWNLNQFPANYQALSYILREYRDGHYSDQDDVDLIPECAAEEENEDE